MTKHLKKITTAALLAAICCASSTVSVMAQAQKRSETVIIMQTDNPYMSVNGIDVSIDDNGTAPVIQDGRTLMPIRAFAESIGANVFWNSSQRTVTITYNGKKIRLEIDSNLAYVDYETKTLDVPATIINDRTFLPIRFVAESFGCDVDWNGDTNTITIELHKENLQHAAVVCDMSDSVISKVSEIVADFIGADLYDVKDKDFTADNYDTVLIGYLGKLPEDIKEVLNDNDFSGKHIAPFCVGDIEDSEREISLATLGAYVDDGLEIGVAELENEDNILALASEWLLHINLIQR